MTNDGLLDLQPLIRKRKAATCEHVHIVVDVELPVLECEDCNATLDPWWYIRRLAADDAATRRYYDEIQARIAAAELHERTVIATLNERIQRNNAEVNRLIAIKNKLWNEAAPDGQPLGSYQRRGSRRRA